MSGEWNMPPPLWNEEIEQSVLGAILIRPQVLEEVMKILPNPDDFYRTDHNLIYQAMLNLHGKGDPVDVDTVATLLKERGQLEGVGGPDMPGKKFLVELSNQVGTATNAPYYSRLVHEKAILRQYQAFGQELMREAGKAGTTTKDLHQFLESRAHDLSSQNGDGWKGIDLRPAILPVHDFKELDIPERTSLLDPFLQELSIGMVTADRGTGKTMLALSFCDAISRGTGFGPWEVGAPSNCLYIDGEMVAHDIIERLGYFAPDRPAQFYILSDHYATLMGFPGTNLLDPSWRSAIKEFCLSHDVRFVVFDNLASLAAGVDENSATEWAPLAKYFLELRFAGIASLLLHHTGKSGTQRGTHAREDALDYSILLGRPKDYEPDQGTSFNLKFMKARVRQVDAHLIAPISLKLERDPDGNYTWTWKATKKANQEAILEMLNQGLKQQEIADAIGVSRSMVAKIKAKAIKEGKLKAR
jgi:RecA-family ATPase